MAVRRADCLAEHLVDSKVGTRAVQLAESRAGLKAANWAAYLGLQSVDWTAAMRADRMVET